MCIPTLLCRFLFFANLVMLFVLLGNLGDYSVLKRTVLPMNYDLGVGRKLVGTTILVLVDGGDFSLLTSLPRELSS